ncbi:MAG: hypothetical protein ACR2HJ_01770 [Fimbriimonadales bacterium]
MKRNQKAEFREFLEALIIEEAGSQAAFAKRLGVSEGRISQLLAPPTTRDISYGLVCRISNELSRPGRREELFKRYQQAFAPDPVTGLVDLDRHDEVDAFIAKSKELVEVGYNDYVLQESKRIHRALREKRGMEEFAIRAGLVATESYFLKDLRPVGLNLLAETGRIIYARKPVHLTLQMLMLQALGKRSLYRNNPSAARQEFEAAAKFLGNLRRTPSVIKAERTLLRDRALLCWDELRCGIEAPDIEKRFSELEAATQVSEDSNERFLAREVLARGAIVLGNFDKAEEQLEKLRKDSRPPLLKVKVLLTEARLSLAFGDANNAYLQILKAINLCDAGGFAHYRHEAKELQFQLIGSDPTKARLR